MVEAVGLDLSSVSFSPPPPRVVSAPTKRPRCTWMEKGRLKDPKDTSAFGIKCDGLPDTDHKDDHVLQHKVDPKHNSKRRSQTQRPKSKSFNLDDAVNTSDLRYWINTYSKSKSLQP